MSESAPTDAVDAMFAIDPHIDAVTELVRRVGALSLRWYRRVERIENKDADRLGGGFDPVTEADRAVETALRAGLEERFPDHAVYGEEFGTTGNGPVRWTIDPIDGTRSFITGHPMWGTLLGCQIEGRPVAGWLYVPTLDETYVGRVGQGTSGSSSAVFHSPEGTENLAVSTTSELEHAIVACTHPSMFAPGPEADGFGRLADAVKMVRYGGDCVNYGLLAAGLIDLVVENGLAPYDIIPLIPIVEAAGGMVTDLEGNPPLDGGWAVAAASPALHEAALAMLR